MTSRISYKLTAILVTLSLLLAPWQQALQARPAPATHVPETVAPADDGTVYLPVLRRPIGPPSFEIISPRQGWTISGMLYFAVQAVHTESVDEVTFLADGTELGTDVTPEDGYRVFLDGDAFPAGELNLTAVATGPAGETSKTVTVNVEPDPPSSATLGAAGGTLETDWGSVVTFPPGSVSAGTTVSVTERTQEEVTAENGIDWEALGVTFLGDQQVSASAPFSLPLTGASADFGNRVQPGQAVVNYTIVPDANGDGVDELVVVNTASVAPNDSVISDPVPQVLISDMGASTEQTGVASPESNGIQGPPGTLVKLRVSGLNPTSLEGNVAIWRSSVDGETFEISGIATPDPLDDSQQVFSAVIPPLTPGPATLSIRNESTGSVSGPMSVTVGTPSQLSRPADEIVLTFFEDAVEYLNALSTSTPEQEEAIERATVLMADALTLFDEALSEDLTPEQEAALQEIARLIESASFYEVPPAHANSSYAPADFTATPADFVAGTSAAVAGVRIVATVAGWTAIAGAATAAGLSMAIASGVIVLCKWYYDTDDCFGGLEPRPPEPCTPTMGAPNSDDFLLGAGALPPPGGNGCGNIIPGSDGALAPYSTPRPQSPQQDSSARFVVKLLGGPISGLADAGNYFFLPFIPAGEIFTAIAFDTMTGDIRMVSGIGPATGDSVLLLFDFASEGGTVPLDFGDVVSGSVDYEEEINSYQFTGAAGDEVLVRAIPRLVDFNLRISVYRPDGTRLCAEESTGMVPVETTCMLDTTGTHTILVGDAQLDDTGTYDLYVQRLNNPGGATTINFHDTVSDTVSPAIKADTYTFPAAAGDHILFRMTRATGELDLSLSVYRPDGTLLCDSGVSTSQVDELCSPDVTGTYTLMAASHSGEEVGPYNLYLRRISDPGSAVATTFDEVFTGTIVPAITMDAFTFSGEQDDQVLVRVATTSGEFDPQIRVYDTDGTLICSQNATASFVEELCSLPATGDYVTLVGDWSADNTGAYEIYMQRTNNPTSPSPLGVGQSLAGTIDANTALDAYFFTGNAGDQLIFRAATMAGTLDPEIRLYRPDGTLLCDGQSPGTLIDETCALDVNGEYTLLVGDWTGDDTGSYVLYVQRTNDPGNATAIAYGDTVTDTVDPAVEMEAYTYTGANGDGVSFQITRTVGTLDPEIRVHRPDGTLLCEDWTTGTTLETTCTLDTAGIHLILIADFGGIDTGDYELFIDLSN